MERALIHAHYYVSKKPIMSSKKQEAKAPSASGNVKDTVMGVHGAGEEAIGNFNGFNGQALHDDKGEETDRTAAVKGHTQ